MRGIIRNQVDIFQRPAVVEAKERIGDWEGDTIVSAHHNGAIVSLVDRGSKLVLLEKAEGQTASEVRGLVHKCLKGLPAHTPTTDNEKEFAYHRWGSRRLGVAWYFVTPYHSWERGLNEHTNGLVRQYLPKGTDFCGLTAKEIRRIETLLNNRSRMCLGYRTPLKSLRPLFRHPMGGFLHLGGGGGLLPRGIRRLRNQPNMRSSSGLMPFCRKEQNCPKTEGECITMSVLEGVALQSLIGGGLAPLDSKM